MSVIIKNIKMPKDCDHCPCFDYEMYDCMALEHYIPPEAFLRGERLSDCPLEEQKEGLWIYEEYGGTISWGCLRCSVCHHPFINTTKFCPNCGAKMESEENK